MTEQTLPGATLEEQIVSAHASGRPVAMIATWFGVSVDQVNHVVAAAAGVPPPAVPVRRRRRIWPVLAIAAAIAAVLAVVVIVVSIRSGSGPAASSAGGSILSSDLEDAKAKCAATESGVRVGDGGKSMIVDSSGKEDFAGIDLATLACLLNDLDAPQAVIAHMDSTRALDGRQEDRWGDYSASWTYHPDNGLDLIIRVV